MKLTPPIEKLEYKILAQLILTPSLYSSVNRRRSALATTSTSDPDMAPFLLASTSDSLLALYTKLLAGKCLTHIGREGQR